MGGLNLDWDKLIKDAISIWENLVEVINEQGVK